MHAFESQVPSIAAVKIDGLAKFYGMMTQTVEFLRPSGSRCTPLTSGMDFDRAFCRHPGETG